MHRGRRSRTRTCGPGSTGRSGRAAVCDRRAGTAAISATGSGYLFAERAATFRCPIDDALFVDADVYAWRALDEQAVCASWIGKHTEAFALCRRLLARDDTPRQERARVAANRDYLGAALLEPAVAFPEKWWKPSSAGRRDSDVTVT